MNKSNFIESNSIECDSLETIDNDKTVLSEQTIFQQSEIIGIENYFYQLFTTFDYIDRILIVLSATSSEILIISLTSIIGAPVGIASASFTLIFSWTTGIVEKLLNITRNKNKKHDKILMLAKSKFNGIETLISQALNDLDISHKEFITILKEKRQYERWKKI